MRYWICMAVLTTGIGIAVPPAHSADLTGEWEGRFNCRWKEGRQIFLFNSPRASAYFSHSGDEIRFDMGGAGYDGRVYESQENPDRGTIGAEGCLNDGNALGGFDDVVQMRFKKRRDTYLVRGTLTTAGSLDGPGRCSFMFRRINTVDPNIPDCNLP